MPIRKPDEANQNKFETFSTYIRRWFAISPVPAPVWLIVKKCLPFGGL